MSYRSPIGRHLFDLTNGWEGVPPAGDHVVVVSHRPWPDDWHPEGFHPVHPRECQSEYYFISDVAQCGEAGLIGRARDGHADADSGTTILRADGPGRRGTRA
jgi:hypothetical protein